jgi:predicted ATPase/DNA-binding SARP family transcriptional activator
MMDNKLALSLLGSPEVQLDGAPITRFRSVKSQALLYYLAMSARPQPRLTIAGLFWGGMDDLYARRNLNRTLSDLTKLVGDHLIVTRQTLGFDRNRPYWLDVERFESALATPPTPARADALAQAIQIYRDDFLAGFYIHDAPDFEQWVLAEQTRLRAGLIQALHELTNHCRAQGNLPQAMDYIRRVLQLEPWREEAHRQLIQLLAQTGQRSAALAQFEICRQILERELQVAPDAATIELVTQIRTGMFAPATEDKPSDGPAVTLLANSATVGESSPPESQGPPHALPPQPTPFVGRASEVAELTRLLLAEPDCRLLTVIGPGGMGKTRVAIKVAESLLESHDQHGKFADGLFFVPLEAVTTANGLLSAIISVIAEEIGFPLHAAAPLQEQLGDFLRDKAMLLVFDNFEQLVKSAELLSEMLTAAPGVKLLVTSREALSLQEAWFYPLVGLSVPEANELPRPEGEPDAVRLFIQCARRTQPAFDQERERAAIVRICQLVEGMPLAIELAATWLKVLPCREIVQEIESGLDILTARVQNIPARHSSMRAVLEQSWRLLTEEERGVAARLSVFRGGFDLQAASAVAGATLPILASLVEKALLRIRPDRRYQMHELTRQYATQQVALVRDLHNAHSQYYANVCQRLTADLYGPQSKAVLDEFTLIIDNSLAAWRWLIQTLADNLNHASASQWLAQVIPPLAEWYYTKALFQAGQQTFAEAAITLSRAGWSTTARPPGSPAPEQTLLAQLQIRIAMFTYELGQYQEVIDELECVLPLLYAWNNADELALALALLGKAHHRRGERSRARTYLQASLRQAQTAQNLLGCAVAFNNLSHIAQAEGEYAESQRLLRESLAIYQRMNLATGVSSTLGNLGYNFAQQGDHEKALLYYHQALSLAKAQDDPMTVMVSISNLAASQSALGQQQTALSAFAQSLQLAREQGNLRWVAANLNGLSQIYWTVHDYPAATRHLAEALAIAGKIASAADALTTISLFARVWMQQGRVKQALQALWFVTHQPAASARLKQEVQALLDELIAELPPAVVAQAQQWAAAQTMEEMIAWVEMQEITPRL